MQGSDVHRAAKTRHAPGPAGSVQISGTFSGIPPPRQSCCYCHGSHHTRNACSVRQSGRSSNGMSNHRMTRPYGVGHRTENAVYCWGGWSTPPHEYHQRPSHHHSSNHRWTSGSLGVQMVCLMLETTVAWNLDSPPCWDLGLWSHHHDNSRTCSMCTMVGLGPGDSLGSVVHWLGYFHQDSSHSRSGYSEA